MPSIAIILLSLIVVPASMVCAARHLLHMLQLNSYQLDGYLRWLAGDSKRKYGPMMVPACVATAVWWVLLRLRPADATPVIFGALCALELIWAVVHQATQSRAPEKKPFVLTARAKRLYACVSVVSVALCALLMSVNLALLAPALMSLVVYLSGALAQPMEKRINLGYFRDAQAKLAARPDVIKIGITGSYGKTSTKTLLGVLLSEKYRVLVPGSSLNTPMGLTRVIREQLTPEHQVFIAEMGARHVGDIRELCELVRPRYGVLTSVGPQHLETFGSIERVMDTKFELIEALPEDGVSFFTADGGYADQLYARARGKKLRAGLSGEDLSVRAEGVEVGPEGSSFTLVTKAGEKARVSMPLLGERNIENALLCCAVALELGLTLEQVARGLSKVEPVEHRLQLIRSANGVIVIDDAFNSNPVGAHAAMQVLRGFSGKRIAVTPGMVELGEREQELNRALGAQMAECCDVAILIGKKRTRPIAQGLADAGFAGELHVVATLAEATATFSKIARAGDAVLFENDLPDNYDE